MCLSLVGCKAQLVHRVYGHPTMTYYSYMTFNVSPMINMNVYYMNVYNIKHVTHVTQYV